MEERKWTKVSDFIRGYKDGMKRYKPKLIESEEYWDGYILSEKQKKIKEKALLFQT